MDKIALDQAAKDYWKLLYGEYGEALVKDIPRRIKAALVSKSRVASNDGDADVRPVAHARDGENMLLEGLYNDQGAKLLFRASIDRQGNVQDIQAIEVR